MLDIILGGLVVLYYLDYFNINEAARRLLLG